jgi:protein ImuB
MAGRENGILAGKTITSYLFIKIQQQNLFFLQKNAMPKRFLSIWFPCFATDRLNKSYPEFSDIPLVLSVSERGRVVIKAVNRHAAQEGIVVGMVLADAKAILPQLKVLPYDPHSTAITLEALAKWSLRFTPIVGTDLPDGLIFDISGCAHLWGGEQPYLETIVQRFSQGGYTARAAIADTIGAAWAMAHYGQHQSIIEPKKQMEALEGLPPVSLRLESTVHHRLHKLGFHRIGQFMHIPRSTLRRRFGNTLLDRLGHALGTVPEYLSPVEAVQPYHERLPCLEPIKTATGIAMALQKLLKTLCNRLSKEGNGIRKAVFKGYRLDGNIQEVSIGTSRASDSAKHLFKLFELHISSIEPKLGIELFVLEAPLIEGIEQSQETLWGAQSDPVKVAQLLDNIAGKIGMNNIRRYLPVEQLWPERTLRETTWPSKKLRPLHLLPHPEPIEVMVPLPDYPPSLFRHRRKVYKLVKADGPERIEQEWWIAEGEARDYYRVEDETGARYWLFRLGQYADNSDPKWFLHGFFA